MTDHENRKGAGTIQVNGVEKSSAYQGCFLIPQRLTHPSEHQTLEEYLHYDRCDDENPQPKVIRSRIHS